MRKHASVLVAVLAVAGSIWLGTTSRTVGQDQTDERLAALETQVADQQSEISDLGNHVRALETAIAGDVPEQSGESSQPEGDVITLSGVDISVTDSFSLSAGRYKVTASVEVDDFDGFAVYVYPSEGREDLLFNEIIDKAGTWTGSAIYEALSDGNYYVEVQNTSSAWTLTFERL